jgi:hypothetical protein
MVVEELTTKNSFFAGFSVEVEGIRIAFAYFNAFKSISGLDVDQAKATRKELKQLFDTHAVVTGDMNSTPRAIQVELNMYQSPRKLFDFPTYLFPADATGETLTVPCFDNFVWDAARVESVSAKPLIELPNEVNVNPRSLIAKNGCLSDHVPVSAIVTSKNRSLNIMIFNVADPTLWYQYYPNAGNGFQLDQASESERQDLLYGYICEQALVYDILFLQEVPSILATRLGAQFQSLRVIDMISAVEVEAVSKLVLLNNLKLT